MSPSASDAAVAPAQRIEFDDPHANMQEAEVTRVRSLRGAWRWALVIATAVTILLCINQQFSLRFFVGYSGWEQDQLAKEIEEKAWLVHPADPGRVMNGEAAELWANSLRDMGPAYAPLANFPEDPTLN